MYYVSRPISKKHSLFAWHLRVFLFVLGANLCAQTALAADLQIFTETRDASELITDENGHTRTSNTMSILIEAMLVESGLDYTSEVVPWSRMLSNLSVEPNTLAYPILRIPEREERFLWIGFLQPVDAYLYGLSSRSEQLPYSLEEARDYRIGAMRGDAFHNYFDAQGYDNLVIIGNNTPWLTMLERGRIDLMPYAQSGVENYLSRLDAPADMLEAVIRLDDLSHPLYFVMNLDSDPELVEIITRAYERVVQSGTFERIQGFSHPTL